jgi:hypothetical protein
MVSVIILSIMGIICASIASSKGRSGVGWFFIGFFTGLIGLIVVLVVGNLNDEKRRIQQSELERRRLEEQLKQERLKNEAFRNYSSNRLDAHDNALEIDTKGFAPETQLGAGSGTSPLLVENNSNSQQYEMNTQPQQQSMEYLNNPDPFSTPVDVQVKYYYESMGETIGPLTVEELKDMKFSGKISNSTLICKMIGGKTEWISVDNIIS